MADAFEGGPIAPRDSFEPITEEGWAALRERYPSAERLDVAFRLALDLETARALLLGQAVDPTRIDREELARARTRRLVRLDLSPADLLEAETA